MNGSNRCARLLIVMSFLALVAALFPAGTRGQDQGWQILQADYGFANQRVDVTKLLQGLLLRGGMNVGVAVNNQTMGGDPAVGKDKSLRILAVDRRNQEREFDYYEGGFITPGTFVVQSDNLDDRNWPSPRNGRDQDYNNRDRDGRNDLSILRGFYGVQGRSVNVTDRLQRMVRDGQLSVNVNNRSLGIDPVPGADKKLIVIYQYRGQEQATAVPEGARLSIP